MTRKAFLMDVMDTHHITIEELQKQGCYAAHIWAIQLQQPIERSDAQNVIDKFNALCHQQYSLDNFAIVFRTKTHTVSEYQRHNSKEE